MESLHTYFISHTRWLNPARFDYPEVMKNSMTWERTFVLLKPDAVRRTLVGEIISRFERAGLTCTALKMTLANRELAESHYKAHQGKPFFPPLVDLLCSGPCVAMSWEGAHAVSVVRKIVGATEPKEASPGTIRGDFCHMSYERSRERLGVIPNLVHASDSSESAEEELGLWFPNGNFACSYQRADAEFL